MIRFLRLPPIVAIFTVLAALAALADADSHRLSHEEARRAVARGEIRPLQDILEVARRDYSAPLIEVEFEIFRGRYVYELVLIAKDGALIELYYDAQTAALLAVERDGGGQELPSLFSEDRDAPWNRVRTDSDERDEERSSSHYSGDYQEDSHESEDDQGDDDDEDD